VFLLCSFDKRARTTAGWAACATAFLMIARI
jgi:hypothetical protein